MVFLVRFNGAERVYEAAQTTRPASRASEQGVNMFKEHEQIVLTAGIRGDGGVDLKRGDVGAIVHIPPGGQALVVEFIALDGDTLAIATVLPSQARPVSGGDMTHARPMEITA